MARIKRGQLKHKNFTENGIAKFRTKHPKRPAKTGVTLEEFVRSFSALGVDRVTMNQGRRSDADRDEGVRF